jgi:hypothetical protein
MFPVETKSEYSDWQNSKNAGAIEGNECEYSNMENSLPGSNVLQGNCGGI